MQTLVPLVEGKYRYGIIATSRAYFAISTYAIKVRSDNVLSFSEDNLWVRVSFPGKRLWAVSVSAPFPPACPATF